MTHNDEGNQSIQKTGDTAIHEWYSFVLSYPDHLVSELITRFGIQPGHVVLDPFAGTGTTLVECKKEGIDSIGVDANPVATFASRVKTTWDIDLDEFEDRKQAFLEYVRSEIEGATFIPQAPPNQLTLDSVLPEKPLPEIDEQVLEDVKYIIPKDALSDLPLRKSLVARDYLQDQPDDSITDIFKLILVSAIVHDMSNVGFGPEIYVKRKKQQDADLYTPLRQRLETVQNDLSLVQQIPNPGRAAVYRGDARELAAIVDNQPVDFVITSPPYPNEKDYTRITRIEAAFLDYIGNRKELRAVKEHMLRSHTRNIYKDDDDSSYVADVDEITEIAEEIERRRIERNGTSGFEKLYHRVATEYFGGMYRALEQMHRLLRPGGKAALVVGDQMSFYQVLIPTARLLSDIASRKLGYREVETLTWRSRLATATQTEIEEHILILERTAGPSNQHSVTLPQPPEEENRPRLNRYSRLIEAIFFRHYEEGVEKINFKRSEIEIVAQELDVRLPKNIGDVIYSFRYRAQLPQSIRDLPRKATSGLSGRRVGRNTASCW